MTEPSLQRHQPDAEEVTHASVTLDYLKTLRQNDLSHALRRCGVDEVDEPVLSDSEIANARAEALVHAVLHVGDQLALLRAGLPLALLDALGDGSHLDKLVNAMYGSQR